MSHNKDIRYLHEVTGDPYAVCRRKMKAAHWDLYKALGYPSFDEILETLTPVIEGVAEAAAEVAKAVGHIIESIDWKEVIRLAAETKAMEADLDPDNYEYNPETGYFERKEITNENERNTEEEAKISEEVHGEKADALRLLGPGG